MIDSLGILAIFAIATFLLWRQFRHGCGGDTDKAFSRTNLMALCAAVAACAAPAAAQEFSHDKQPIPEAYRGVWALDTKYCADGGEAVVNIGPRTIDFYERHGYLDLAQLNEGTDPPEFYGNFRWIQLLHFSQGVVRLGMVGDKLHITEADDPDASMNPAAWTKCPRAGQR